MKNRFVYSLFLICSLGLALNVKATNTEEVNSSVSSIYLKSTGSTSISWSVDGYSSNGFKIVWSKNEYPTYPLRDGDRYHYFTEPNKNSDTLEAFNGNGEYYVRVCEYLGGKCGVYSNQITMTLGKTTESEVSNNDEEKVKETDTIPQNYEKIPNMESIQYYTNIKKIGDSLYGIKIDSLKIPSGYEKILKLEDVKYYKNIRKIGTSLYGVKIEDPKKKALRTKIDNISEQIKKLQDQLLKLTEELNKLN